jgi:formylglycine-generating enzyme required for sulfatase activity
VRTAQARFCGSRGGQPPRLPDLAGNVWEWVSDRTPDGWGVGKGGSYLDIGWGLRASRTQEADASRPTNTTGFRIAVDPARSA